MNPVRFLFALGSISALLTVASAASASDFDLTVPTTLRPGVTSDVVVTVRENPKHPHCSGPSILAVHGLAHTAATWNPLVDALFAMDKGRPICHALLVDLPGHGKSPLPQGLAFGTLLVDDYVTAVLGTLDVLKAQGMGPQAIIGHSMGGLVTEGVQARLLAQGTSLASQYGIRLATLMSPSGAREHSWAFADSGQAVQTIGPFATMDPAKGPVLRVDAPTWDAFFFMNYSQQFSPGTPSPAEVVSGGYLSDEAYYAGAELVGAAPFQRISVGDAPFALSNGTLLLLANPSQDTFSIRTEAEAAYVQLTGDRSMWGFLRVDDASAVHDMHVARPGLYLEKIGDALRNNL